MGGEQEWQLSSDSSASMLAAASDVYRLFMGVGDKGEGKLPTRSIISQIFGLLYPLCWKLLKRLNKKLSENSEYFENRLNI